MKRFLFLLALLLLAGCSKQPSISLDGTSWYLPDEGYTLSFSGNVVIKHMKNLAVATGTYSLSGNKVTFLGLIHKTFTSSRYTYAIIDGDTMTAYYIYGEGDVLLPSIHEETYIKQNK